ncbi:MAG: hypothetical protein KDD36_12080 [Flavobacteriales bacterium]|nr:hypothetical protein [Flavobacteriales bacterium]
MSQRKYFFVLFFLVQILNFIPAYAVRFSSDQFTISIPDLILADEPTIIKVSTKDLSHPDLVNNNNTVSALIGEETVDITFSDDGNATIEHTFHSENTYCQISIGNFQYSQGIHPMPLWYSILPPLLAIIIALLFKEVIIALVSGCVLGGMIFGYFTQGALGILKGILNFIDTYVINALADPFHASIIVFSLTIGGMVGVISRNGGMQGIVDRLSKYASTRKSGQMVTWILGIAVFFDDYANALVVGNTMRPITDRLRISREKLSYIVDSTAAPVSAVAFITTWIGAELSYIQDGVASTGITESSYSIFFSSLSYSFYPIFTLFFIFLLIMSGRDFGAMFKAEQRASNHGQVESENSKRLSSDEMKQFEVIKGAIPAMHNALLPLLVLILGAIAGLLSTGLDGTISALADQGIAPLSDSIVDVLAAMSEMQEPPENFFEKIGLLIGNADSYKALMWASLGAVITAIVLSISQKIMNLEESISAATSGMKAMFTSIIILILAWALASVTTDLHTADFITGSLLSSGIDPGFLPAITFLMAAVIAFSTGSSWGTMAILYPLILGATWSVCQDQAYTLEETMPIFYNVVSCVLAGAVLGDHCSPISDTTILSSLSTSCNHIDHVRTQLPYAATVGGVALLAGTLLTGLGMSPIISYAFGGLTLAGIIFFAGKKV